MPATPRSPRPIVALILIALAAPPLVGAATDPDPVRIVVGFHAMPQGAAQGSSYEGAPIVHADDTLRFVVVATDDPARFTARAQQDDRVRYVEPDGTLEALFSPNDPYFANGQQYGPTRIRAPQAWDRTLGTTAASVCVIDSGVRRTHEDIASERYAGGIDYIDDDSDPNDQNGHGTFTTAIAVGRTNNARGIAGMTQSTWRHARVLDAGGSGSPAELGTAMRWCSDNGAHILSMSLGTGSDVTAMRDGATYVWNRGGILVAASGNNGCVGSGCILFPARYANVIAVGATTNTDARWASSNGGPELDVVAPGADIISAHSASNTAYAQGSGTSAAAPHVAGALGILKSQSPSITNGVARDRLYATARDLGSAGWDQEYGHGIVRTDDLLQNTPPSVAFSCSPVNAVTSRTVNCTAIVADADLHGVAVTLDWGDGETVRMPETGFAPPGTALSATRRFVFTGTYEVSATPADNASVPATGSTRFATLVVGDNTAPTMRSIACSPSPGSVNVPATCQLRADDDSDGVAYTVDWGDGTVERWPATGFATPGASFPATHAYAYAALFDIYVRPVDDATPALLGATLAYTHEVAACDLFEEGSFLAPTLGLRVSGWTTTRVEGISPGCGGQPFRLNATGTLVAPDVDVCWWRDGTQLSCHTSTGNEAGTIPIGADRADVYLFNGANARWTLRAPAP